MREDMQRLLQTVSRLRPSYLATRAPPCLQLSTEAGGGEEQTPGEKKITEILHEKFPKASFVQVSDISGGCGSMYEVQIETAEFKGKRTIMQHRLVNEALKEEIKDMHGIRISTSVPES